MGSRVSAIRGNAAITDEPLECDRHSESLCGTADATIDLPGRGERFSYNFVKTGGTLAFGREDFLHELLHMAYPNSPQLACLPPFELMEKECMDSRYFTFAPEGSEVACGVGWLAWGKDSSGYLRYVSVGGDVCLTLREGRTERLKRFMGACNGSGDAHLQNKVQLCMFAQLDKYLQEQGYLSIKDQQSLFDLLDAKRTLRCVV